MGRRKTWLEKLMDVIPGFKGYRSREYIREDDQALREYLSNLLMESINILDDAVSNLAEYDFKTAEALDSLTRELRISMDKIRWAVHGYAPHYDINKVDEEELGKLKEVDEKFIEVSDKIKELSSKIVDETLLRNSIEGLLKELRRLLKDLKNILEERDKVITGWILQEGGE